MAYEVIYRQIMNEYEQEEIIDRQLVADPDTGIVTEVETLIQPQASVKTEMLIKQEILADENISNFRFELWTHATAGERGDGFSLKPYSEGTGELYLGGKMIFDGYNSGGSRTGWDYDTTEITLQPGETKSFMFLYAQTNELTFRDMDADNRIKYVAYHDIEGYFHKFACKDRVYEGYLPKTLDLSFSGYCGVNINNLLVNGELTSKETLRIEFSDITPTPLPINRATYPTTANNFTDEENPSFTYAATTSRSFVDFNLANVYPAYSLEDTIVSIQAALSFDGETADIDYRDIPIDGTAYTFELTEAERELLRIKAQGSDTVPIYYLTKTTRSVGGVTMSVITGGNSSSGIKTQKKDIPLQTAEHVGATQRNLTIVGCYPTINPTVKDIKEETLALTGDENTFIRYESMAEFAINATASKHATIVSQSVTCGSKTVSNLPYGVIQDTESGTFTFHVTDSRNMGVSGSVFKNLVEYVKPTCYQALEIGFSSDVGAQIKVVTSGNYYNGSFGAADNELTLEVRYAAKDEEMGEWQLLTGTPTFNGNTYELETVFSGFSYDKAYVFQCRATDKLNVVESSQYTIKLMPTFDWSENDFNFNVPINIEADNLDMYGTTVLRHNKSAKNTVLSADGGHIYLRPGGTDDTSGETIIYPDGSVKFGGAVDFDSFTIEGNTLADYIIEAGEEAMGTNGTWYWRKWASGKAECWGCRNFGNMAVTTAWGGLYRSAFLTQDLPENVFKTTPDVININIVNATFGGWICKHENQAPSAATTGSFIFVRPASATVTAPTYIGFHVIGVWKQ